MVKLKCKNCGKTVFSAAQNVRCSCGDMHMKIVDEASGSDINRKEATRWIDIRPAW